MKYLLGVAGLVLVLGGVYFVVNSKDDVRQAPLEEQLVTEEDFTWLEEVEGEEAIAWVQKQNEKTLDELRAHPLFAELQSAALEIVNDRERLPSVSIRGDDVYNLWQDENAVRGIWRRMSWQNFLSGSEDWETVIDVDALAKAEGKSWVWKGSQCLRPDYEKCLIYLSDGGKDASFVREFNSKTKEFVNDGFIVPEAKTNVTWLDENSLLVTTALFPEFTNQSGYGYKVQLWQRGQELKDAPVVFSADFEDVFIRPMVIEDGDQRHVMVSRSRSFFTQELFYRDGEEFKPLGLPEDINFEALLNGYLVFSLRKDGLGHERGDVLAISLDELLSAKEAQPQLIFRPNGNQAVAGLSRSGDHLLLFYLEDVRGKVAKIQPPQQEQKSERWSKTLVDVADQGSIRLMTADQDSDRVLLTYEDFLTPPSILLLEPSNQTRVLRSQPSRFVADGLKIEQHFASSADGTKVPYFLVFHPEKVKQGPAPTLLYGYGGFEISLTPSYSSVRGRLWLEKGGVYAIANIRGGGEYGPAWHQAALQKNRQKAYDDFIAVAENLIETKVTNPQKLAIQGGSNGGLLVGAVFTQRPELFAGVICQVPLLDMLRYHKLLAGASWVGEYGDPEDPVMAEVLRNYSPFHNLEAERTYPEVFFITSTKDDRVHPGHARKMAAKMLQLGHEIYYFENIEGGHSASADLQQRAERYALEYTYLWQKLDPPMSH
ncbi:MAG: prolyl oligopeptidase family serine peptidase [Oligoflexus sp.]